MTNGGMLVLNVASSRNVKVAGMTWIGQKIEHVKRRSRRRQGICQKIR